MGSTQGQLIADKYIPLAWILALVPLFVASGSAYFSTRSNADSITHIRSQRVFYDEKFNGLRVEVGSITTDIKHIEREIRELKELQARVLRAVEK